MILTVCCSRLFRVIDIVFSCIFLLDLLLNLFSHWFSAFVAEKKNLLDFGIVFISFWGSMLPASGLPSQVLNFLTNHWRCLCALLPSVSR